ncbi:hypothetical protein ACKWTF_010261 [Chironomus riparius]
MNPMTNMKNVTKLSEQELKSGNKTSWHDQYRGSSWIFVGGLPYDLTEGDIISVFSQYGEIVNLNLIRDKKTGKQKGFSFVCYEDQRSTVLAVDNLNGIKILGKSIRVDHVQDYKPPKDDDRYDDLTRKLHTEGCAPKIGDPQYIRAETSVKREKSPARRDFKRERSSNRRNESPIRRDIKREVSRVSNRSTRRRSRSNERKRKDSSSDRSDGKHRHHHKQSSKKKDRKKRKRHSSTTSSSESN